MQKEKLVPEIRFKGFEEEWKESKIGNFLSTPIEEKANVNNASQLLTLGLNLSGLKNGATKNKLHFGATNYFLRKEGQFIYGKQNFFNGSMAIITPEFHNKASSKDVPSFDVNNIDNWFFYYYLARPSFYEKTEGLSLGTGSKRIHENILFNITIAHPESLKEQKKIRKLISNLNSIVSLTLKKINKLRLIKESFLSKMFASENQKFPEIRFKGFDDEWVKFKLGDIGIFNSNGVDKVFREKDNAVHMVNYMDVYNKVEITLNNIDRFMITTANNSELIKNNLIKGDILFTPSSETIDDIGHTFVVQETIPNLVYSYHLVRFRPNSEEFYETFANYCLDQKRLCDQYMLRAQGVQRFVLNREHFNSLSVIKPSILEQKKINKFLFSLDSLIRSQELKLEKLNNIKQALLEKMFC
ncbi:restriction endonuclease subunit S [Mycoplasma sp. 1458C]|uniref:restriction endonuclease subunit S n=1 Tax=Mycoplasma sp. 1458C TaxID=3401661 RepID=UPI003AAC0778